VDDTVPEGLVGPSSVVSVQIEGIYSKAIIDSGSQVTLLYRSFYDKYLTHLPLTSINTLQIWGLSPAEYPYDGYLSLRLEFLETDVGVSETIDVLVLVCPDPVVRGEASMLIGTNTPTVRRLLSHCREREEKALREPCTFTQSSEKFSTRSHFCHLSLTTMTTEELCGSPKPNLSLYGLEESPE